LTSTSIVLFIFISALTKTETISYILSGSLSHEDFTGAKGHVSTGGLQFMTAGRGIMHSEIPNPSPSGAPNIGLQLWVDLPSHLKLCPPRYRDLPASEIPLVELDEGRVRVKVISGKVGGVERGRDLTYVGVWYLDFEVEAGECLISFGWDG
jgi:redox-sensitive bicupin YhaK (pirin superfamily)